MEMDEIKRSRAKARLLEIIHNLVLKKQKARQDICHPSEDSSGAASDHERSQAAATQDDANNLGEGQHEHGMEGWDWGSNEDEVALHTIIDLKQESEEAESEDYGDLGSEAVSEESSVIAGSESDNEESEAPFRCATCGARFNRRTVLERHMTMHSGEKPFECATCGVRFRHDALLEVHQAIHVAEKPYKCPICGRAFSRLSTAASHEKTHSEEERAKRAELATRGSHDTTQTGQEAHECATCGEEFRSTTDKAVHESTHSGEEPYKCTICGEVSSSMADVATHEKVHVDNAKSQHQCASESNLKGHEWVHNTGRKTIVCVKARIASEAHAEAESRAAQCDLCRLVFSLETSLARHRERMHALQLQPEWSSEGASPRRGGRARPGGQPPWPRPPMCALCGQVFRATSRLTRHLWAHTRGKTFACAGEIRRRAASIASTSDAQLQLLEVGEKQQCQSCGVVCSSRAVLARHARVHKGVARMRELDREEDVDVNGHGDERSGKAPVCKCEVCGEEFRYRYARLKHERKHSKKERLQCLTCGKDFKYRYTLLKHESEHTKDKRFQCPTCGKEFRWKYELVMHEGFHSAGRRPLKCAVCGKGYSRKFHLARHEITHTKEKQNLRENVLQQVDIEVAPGEEARPR